VLGDILVQLGRYDEGIIHLQKAVQLYPDLVGHREFLAEAYHKAGRYEEAVATLEPVLELDPESYYALQALGDSLRRLGKHDEAIKVLRKVVDLHPRDSWAQVYLGVALQSAGRNADAIRVFEPLLRPDSTSSTAKADFDLRDDGSVIVSGAHQMNDDYLIISTLGTTPVSALKLEVLADRTLPNSGPGRHETGNFQLGELSLEYFHADLEDATPLSISGVWASYAWKDRPVERSIDGDKRTAWHVWGGLGKSHVAVFRLNEPLVGTN
jgi:tetratricopeptide (TPR) repeat protein